MCSLPDLPRASGAPAGLLRPVNSKPNIEAPKEPCAIAFIDGQNLFHCAEEAFGHTYPNYDPLKLAQEVCRQNRWKLTQTRFYTGYPLLSAVVVGTISGPERRYACRVLA